MSTQQDNFTEIADALRWKELSSSDIVANDFADRIRALPTHAWEYPTDWPDPEQLVQDAIADANDPSVKSGFVMFFDSSEETYTFYAVKYLYGSDGQKITGSGGYNYSSITFDGDSYEVKASGRAIRWVVILQDISETTSYIGSVTYLPSSCINIYVSEAVNTLYCNGYLLYSSTLYKYQLESIVFGRENADGANYFQLASSFGLIQNFSAFVGLINAKIKFPAGSRGMNNYFANAYNLRIFPEIVLSGTNQFYSPVNMGVKSYATSGTAYVPISSYTTSHNFQYFFSDTGADEIRFTNNPSSIRITTLTYAMRYAQNLKKISCENAMTIDVSASPLYCGEFAYSLESIEPVLDCTNMGSSSSLSIFNNGTGTQTRNYAIKDIKMILSPTYSVNLERTMHCATITSWEFLANNAPDVSGSPLTLTIGSYLITKLNSTTEGQAVLSTLTGKGWVIA